MVTPSCRWWAVPAHRCLAIVLPSPDGIHTSDGIDASGLESTPPPGVADDQLIRDLDRQRVTGQWPRTVTRCDGPPAIWRDRVDPGGWPEITGRAGLPPVDP